MSRLSDFIGVPYGFRDEPGLDCYQLVVRVLDKVFNKQIPDYNFTGDWKTCDTGFLSHRSDFIKVDNPEPGDIVLLLLGGRPLHCGVVVKPESMLHSLKGSNSCIEKFTTIKWKNRIEGFYRWVN